MAETIAQWIVLAATAYVAIGVLFAVPFLIVGIKRIDPAAHGSGPGFRLVIAPGVVALWPILLRRWIGGTPPPTEHNAHRERAARSTSGSAAGERA